MSEAPAEKEAVLLPYDVGPAFAALMDALVPDEAAETTATGGEAAGADAAAAGQPAAPAQGAGGTPVAGVSTPGGDGGQPVVPGAGGAAGAAAAGTATGVEPAADEPTAGVGTADYADVKESFGELSTALEENVLKVHQTAAYTEVQTEHPKYFEMIQHHPRELVGMEVQSLAGEGMERLKDTQDAADWIAGVKVLLSREIQTRAMKAMEEDGGMLKQLHSSIELFQNNGDLVPGTKQFDKELADQFAKLAKPYENRVEGKLVGWNIPVQPLIEMLRGQLKEARAAKAAAPPAAGAPAGQPAPAKVVTPKKVEPPQTGIPSRTGESSEQEDFSALFGTIGLKDFRL